MAAVNWVFLMISLVARCDSKMEGKVIGGEYTLIKSYPHAVYLAANCPGSQDVTWICGGSVLNQELVITAAHCLEGCVPKKKSHSLAVYAGNENLKKVTVVRLVIGLATHSKYDDVSYENDIGLAIVDKAFPLGANIKRVIIPNRFYWKTMARGVLAGWGITDDDTEEETLELKAVHQTLRGKMTCRILGYLSPGMLCAGSLDNDADRPAGGDSGSALITASFVEVGLLSFRKNRHPALLVYTNTTYYHHWIEKTSYRLYCVHSKNDK